MANLTAAEKNFSMLKSMTNNESLKKRFQDVMKENAPSFMASVISAVSGNDYLKKCDPNTVWNSALVAATLKLPIDPNLGFAYIVPYKEKAQFQMGYKGFVQLAIRSGQYKNIHVTEVFEDELKAYDPVSGIILFSPLSERKDRENGDEKKIIGYYARFELVTGFAKDNFMFVKEVNDHAKKFSQSYKKGYGVWKDEFDSMAKKTVLKLLLNKWGILSVELQKAVVSDQAVIENEEKVEYIDNKPEEKTTTRKDDLEDL